MLTIPPSLTAPLQAHAALLIAAAIGLAGGWACRSKTRAGYLPAVAAAALLAGWAALLPRSGLAQAWAPRGGTAVLVAPALVIAVAAVGSVWSRGRLGRWLPWVATVLAGWWLARWGAPAPQFWRAWVAVLVAAAVLRRACGDQAARGLAGALTLSGGLIAAGGGAWAEAVGVAAAALAGLALAGGRAALPASALAVLVVGADMAEGRAWRGHVGTADLACLLALASPWVAGALAARLGRRLGPAGPVAGAVGAAAIACVVVWLFRRASVT